MSDFFYDKKIINEKIQLQSLTVNIQYQKI